MSSFARYGRKRAWSLPLRPRNVSETSSSDEPEAVELVTLADGAALPPAMAGWAMNNAKVIASDRTTGRARSKPAATDPPSGNDFEDSYITAGPGFPATTTPRKPGAELARRSVSK